MTHSKAKAMPSAAFFRGVLTYDPFTGIFRWNYRFDIPDCYNRRYTGQIAGCIDARGYRRIRINGKSYAAHRIAWVYMTDQILPDDVEIDHKNGKRSDNRFDNLREATLHQQAANATMRKDNSSGIKGVSWNRRCRKWQAQINHKGIRLGLGYFDNKDDAKCAYEKRADALFGEFVRR